jgi:predicted SAM-dependent methyltransferase
MRLNIGASVAQLMSQKLAILLDREWIHLGDPDLEPAHAPVDQGSPLAESSERDEIAKLNAKTNYIPFYYRRGDRLPFDKEAFSFGFSEHFFEHLFLDESCELLKECRRILAPGACLRLVVPDADLRTYLPVEPAGFTNSDPRWFHPDKHKTRWSIYSLSYVLEEIGFRTRGVVYCDKFGVYHRDLPEADQAFYAQCQDLPLVLDTSYILRFDDSLVVDALRPADQ